MIVKKSVFLSSLILLIMFCNHLKAGSEEFLSNYNSLSDAITSIGTTEASLVIDQNATLTADLTVPANINLRFVKGNTISGTYTLTVNGNITAGQWQIFGSDITPAGTPLVKSILPEWFPGTDTQAIQAAIDFAATAGTGVTGSTGKTYNVSSVRIKNGVKSFIFKGSIAGDGTSQYGIITLDGPALSTTAVDRCYISANIDMSNGDHYGIESGGCTNCVFDKCRINNFTNTTSHGMLFRAGSNYNKVINCEITGYENPSATSIGIYFLGTGGYSNSGFSAPSTPCVGNIISRNKLQFSTAAVYLLGCENVTVTENYFYKNKSFAMYIANSTSNCIIADNLAVGFSSSGIMLTSGASKNKINANICKQIAGYNSVGASYAAICATSGATENVISGNHIESFNLYGIYLIANVAGNIVKGNKISQYYRAAIALENDWQSAPLPGDAIYSTPGTSIASVNTESNVIQNNVIDTAYTGRQTGAIYVAQFGSTLTQNNTIQDNIIIRTQPTGSNSLYFYEQTSGNLTGNILRNNTVREADLTKMFFTRGREHFSICSGNDAVDNGTVTFTTGDTTPSVEFGGSFATNNTSSTTITDFDYGYDGQVFTLQLDQYTTIQYSSSAIYTKGSANIVGSSSNQFVTFLRRFDRWFEISRNF